MDTLKKATEIARRMRKKLVTRATGLPVPTKRTGEDLTATAEEVWDEAERGMAGDIKEALDEAYAAGKADGLREAAEEDRAKKD